MKVRVKLEWDTQCISKSGVDATDAFYHTTTMAAWEVSEMASGTLKQLQKSRHVGKCCKKGASLLLLRNTIFLHTLIVVVDCWCLFG